MKSRIIIITLLLITIIFSYSCNNKENYGEFNPLLAHSEEGYGYQYRFHKKGKHEFKYKPGNSKVFKIETIITTNNYETYTTVYVTTDLKPSNFKYQFKWELKFIYNNMKINETNREIN